MLVPCVQCGKKDYTDESPLWHFCHRCLHEKEEKKHRCSICGSEYNLNRTDFVHLCPKCSKVYQKAFGDSYSHCDQCDNEFPVVHLFYSQLQDMNLCNRCYELYAG